MYKDKNYVYCTYAMPLIIAALGTSGVLQFRYSTHYFACYTCIESSQAETILE